MVCKKCILAIQIISCVLGVLMNLLVLLVRLVKLYHRRRISSYHFIIVNIALADLIFALLIILDINSKDFQWPYSEGACQVVKPLQVITGDIPGLFMVLLAFERYRGTIKPLGQRFRMRTLKIITFLLWFFTIGVRFPYGFYLKMHGNYCLTKYPFPQFHAYYRHVVFTCFVVIPFTVTSVLHVMICLAIKKHSSRMAKMLKHTADLHQKICITSRFSSHSQQDDQSSSSLEDDEKNPSIDSVFFSDNNPDNNPPKKSMSKSAVEDLFQKLALCGCTSQDGVQQKKHKSSFQRGIKLKIHILALISLAFFFCMFPSHLYHLLFIYKKLPTSTINFNVLVVLTWMKYLHCFVNGLIYSVLDERFRSDMCAILKSIFTCKPHYKLEFRRSILSQSSVDTTML